MPVGCAANGRCSSSRSHPRRWRGNCSDGDLTHRPAVTSTEVMDMKRPFERVVVDHGPTVLRVCRVVVGVGDAEDAWAETFVAAMRAYPGLPEDANVEAWLVTIAHRKAFDILRARQRRAVPVEEV